VDFSLSIDRGLRHGVYASRSVSAPAAKTQLPHGLIIAADAKFVTAFAGLDFGM